MYDIESKLVFKEFYQLYEKSWGKKKNFAQFLEKFIDRSAGKNWVRIDLLEVDGFYLAGMFHLSYRDVIYYYLMALDKDYNPKISVGNVMMGLSIKSAIQDKYNVYDLLKGSERFKFHWANDGHRLFSIIYYSKKLGPILYYSFDSVKKLGKILLR
ncbi:MAG: GNAT family N-acetyltransferase [Candidatus Heimdallarchaeota archaeon]